MLVLHGHALSICAVVFKVYKIIIIILALKGKRRRKKKMTLSIKAAELAEGVSDFQYSPP